MESFGEKQHRGTALSSYAHEAKEMFRKAIKDHILLLLGIRLTDSVRHS